jgi:hypothetical protein
MDTINLTSLEWDLLGQLIQEGRLPIKSNTLRAIRYRTRRWTDELAIAVHAATNGKIPCWKIRPDHYTEGVVPPCLLHASSE